MSIHVGTSDRVVVADGYEFARWDIAIAHALGRRPRLACDGNGAYYCGQAAWNIWVTKRPDRHERRADRWELLDRIGDNLRDIRRGWGDNYRWTADEEMPF